jgi:hypothetical protein
MPGKDIPEITYKTFYNESEIHIAPTLDGVLMPGHQIEKTCNCWPLVLRNGGIIAHRIIH